VVLLRTKDDGSESGGEVDRALVWTAPLWGALAACPCEAMAKTSVHAYSYFTKWLHVFE